MNGKLVVLDDACVKTIVSNSSTITITLKRTPIGTYVRYTAFLVLCNQDANLVGAYAIGVNNTKEKINKIIGIDASISRDDDNNVTITFNNINNIWCSCLLIAPRDYV